jgi:hypothetical protein
MRGQKPDLFLAMQEMPRKPDEAKEQDSGRQKVGFPTLSDKAQLMRHSGCVTSHAG